MRGVRIAVPWLLIATAAGMPALAQEQNVRRVEVSVTAISGNSVYLDQGREALVREGDSVRLFPPGSDRIDGTIRSVSRTSSRAELRGSVTGIDVGTRGEIWIPEARFDEQENAKPEPAEKPPAGAGAQGETPPAQEPEKVEHPPWEQPPENWDTDVPLLAPAHAREPEERERTWHGRIFTGYDYTNDDQYGSTYEIWRSGVDFEAENPFSRGGQLRFEADYFSRRADVEDGQGDSESRLRIDRLSYRWGGLRGRPNDWEVGRFLHKEFPELGVLDGGEYVHRLGSGSRMGVSLGFLPEPTDEFKTGDDFEVALFHRFVSDESETFSFGTAYQKTWHEGAADRDLLVNTLEYHPNRNTSVHTTTWVDFYTSGDTRKNASLELSQAQFDARYRSDRGNGAGIFASHLRWPDIQRNEFQNLTDQQIADNYTSRIGTNGWLRTSKRTRLSTRIDYWEDQDDSGTGGSVRFSLSDLLYDRGEVSFEVFTNQGKFSDATGGRVYASRRLDHGFLNAYLDATNFEQVDFLGSQADLQQYRAGLSYDTSFLNSWDLSLYAEDRFGDEQDSWSVGVFLQRRF